ncbi:MAG: hypothetical protein Kow0073_09190 [Immundisolibacter sp.]
MGKLETPALPNASRRAFLKGGGVVTLSLTQLSGVLSGGYVKRVFAAEKTVDYAGPDDLYRQLGKG